MTENLEEQWAVALKKSRQKQTVPLATQKNNLLEQIKLNKKKLLLIIKNKNKIEIQNIFEQLLKLRARLALLNLKIIKQEKYFISKEMIQEELAKYLKESEKLAKSINLLTK